MGLSLTIFPIPYLIAKSTEDFDFENDFLGPLNLESNILIYFLSFEGAPVQGLRGTIFLDSEIAPLDKTLPARYWY